MAQYINKSALVAEIKGYISNYKEIVAKISRNDSTWVDSVSMIESKIGVLQHLLAFLDTLEVKEVQEESVSEDLEEAAHLYVDTTIEYFDSEDNPCCYPAFIAGAQWQKDQDQSTIELAEDHAMLAGMDKMKQEIIDKAMVWLTSNMKWGVVSWDDKEECVRNFKKAMEE